MDRSRQIKALYEQAQTMSGEKLNGWLETLEPSIANELRQLLDTSDTGHSYFKQFTSDLFGFDENPEDDHYSLIGQRIDRYRVDELIGYGGMGVVYRGYDLKLERDVALKLVAPASALSNQARSQLLIEARLASQLEHPNIATIYEITSTDNGQDVIVMAYYRGKTLQQKLDENDLEPQHVLHWLQQLLSGLRYAHRYQVIHRDIKPSNLMILEDGTLQILDFGSAVTMQEDSFEQGGQAGTTGFMSPEQIRQQPLNSATDFWSVGVVVMTVAQKLGWMDKVNAFVWAQNPAASRQIEPQWVFEALRRLLCVDPGERTLLVDELTPELLSNNVGTVRFKWRHLGVAAAVIAITVGSYLFYSMPVPAPTYKKVVLTSPERANPIESTIRSELSDWLKNVDADSPEISYLGIETDEQAINGENVAINLSVEAELEYVDVKVAIKGHRGKIALWQERYNSGDLNLMVRDLQSQLGLFLEAETTSKRIISNFATFQDAEAYRLYLESKSLLDHCDSSPTNSVEFLDNIESVIHKALTLEANPALDLNLASLNRHRYDLTGNPDFLDSAIRLLNRALSVNDKLLQAYVEMGHIYSQKGEFGSAAAAFSMGRQLYPNHTDIYSGLTRVYLRSHDYQQAKALLAEYESIAPYDWRVYNYLGELAALQQKDQQAVSYFRMAQEMLPDDVDIKTNMISSLQRLGRIDKAKQLLQQVVDTQQSFKPLYRLGLVEFELGNYDAAIGHFKRALSYAPSDVATMGGIAMSYYFSKPQQTDKSSMWFAKAIESGVRIYQSAPSDIENIERIALFYSFLGDENNAKRFRDKMLEARNAGKINYLVLINMHELLGQRDQALKWLQRWREYNVDWRQLETQPSLKALVADTRYHQIKSDQSFLL